MKKDKERQFTNYREKIAKKYPEFEWVYRDTNTPCIHFGMNANPICARFGERTMGMAGTHKKSGWRDAIKFPFKNERDTTKSFLFCADKIVEKYNKQKPSTKYRIQAHETGEKIIPINEDRVEPIFEVFSMDKKHHYKIYENGRIEGFPKGMVIFNRIIPKVHQLQGKIKMLEKELERFAKVCRP